MRLERDPLGEVRVPADAYWGAQTARAVENFPISGITAPAELVTATVLIKQAAAQANGELGRLDRRRRRRDRRRGRRHPHRTLRDQFVVDVYQAGAGTSHNMNTNEVLANLAAERPRRAARRPTSGSIRTITSTWASRRTTCFRPPRASRSCWCCLGCWTRPRGLADALDAKAREFAHVLKTGRTHLQDAVPITLGQEFGGFAANVAHAAEELKRSADPLHELNLGATAVGTG